MNTRTAGAAAFASLVLSAVLLTGCTTGGTGSTEVDAGPGASLSTPTPALTGSPVPDEVETSVEAQLRYLIEEEKLAHDVYVALGDLWGTRIFTNIAASETTHEGAVAQLLSVYGIDDPRSSAPGVFADPALQALYDELIAVGSQSPADAIGVGITIEQTDIADLSAALPDAPSDVAAVLERLLAASQNHLAAFERQG
jgi:hypothetical protein